MLSFKGQTVVVTGAGGGLGKAYCLLFASRGANVVVNDFNAAAAQSVVDQIVRSGGKAVVNTSSVTDGEAVVRSALEAFGNITILINNAGILRDRGILNMTDQDWDQVMQVHLKGTYACTKAAWPIFRNQKYGRILNTSSAAGLYGSFGQSNYSAAKMAIVGFTKTLALEGEKYNIKAVALAPIAASAMTETIWPAELLANLKPEAVAPFVAAVCHPNGPDTSGKVYEVAAGFAAELRFERSQGVLFCTDSSYTPSAVKARWNEVLDFSNPSHPQTSVDENAMTNLERASKLRSNPQATPPVAFDGQTVIVTGAGAGLGRAYALMFGALGANVVANDVNQEGVNAVVGEITKARGKAVAVICSAEAPEKIIQTALDAFGSIHVLVANAGIIRPRTLISLSEEEWDAVIAVHLRGTFKCARAVWPTFQKQKYGRIVTITSPLATYGHFGQINYSAAKAGILGLTRTLALEGSKYNIVVTAVAPSAGTAMTATIWPEYMVNALKPEYIAPVVGYLSSSDNIDNSGGVFEVSGPLVTHTRIQRAGGHAFSHKEGFTPEDVLELWDRITSYDSRATYPTVATEAIKQIFENFGFSGTVKTVQEKLKTKM